VEALVASSQAGDLDAFEGLYERFRGTVHGLCLRMAGTRDLAEEMTQETFLRVWNNLGAFRGESSFGTWLHRLTANTACQMLRSRARILEDALAQDALEAVSNRQPPTRGVESRLLLQEAVTSLPKGAREVVVLRDIEGFSYAEISELTGLALGTIKAQIHRGRRLLLERMQQ
jgi:RNA polymerase sigma-70 factor, ECF subfamily